MISIKSGSQFFSYFFNYELVMLEKVKGRIIDISNYNRYVLKEDEDDLICEYKYKIQDKSIYF